MAKDNLQAAWGICLPCDPFAGVDSSEISTRAVISDGSGGTRKGAGRCGPGNGWKSCFGTCVMD